MLLLTVGEPASDAASDNKTKDCTKMTWTSAEVSWNVVSCCVDDHSNWTACQKRTLYTTTLNVYVMLL